MQVKGHRAYKGFQNFNIYSIHEGIFGNEDNYSKFIDLCWKCSTYDAAVRELFYSHLRSTSTDDGVTYTMTAVRLAITHHVGQARKAAKSGYSHAE